MTFNFAVALVGNPGSGKSTLLNGLIGTPEFRSGISFGTGLTTSLKQHEKDGVTFIDTPGLDDVDTREHAAAELDRLLLSATESNDLKLVFVVTEVNGRIRPEDAATIALVLDAITGVNNGQVETNGKANADEVQDMTDRFAIVINQASKTFADTMRTDNVTEGIVKATLTGGNKNRQTQYWAYVMKDPKFDAVDNGVLLCPQVMELIKAMRPSIEKGRRPRAKIDVRSFEKKMENAMATLKKKERQLLEELKQKTFQAEKLTRKVERQVLESEQQINYKNQKNSSTCHRQQSQQQANQSVHTQQQPQLPFSSVLRNNQLTTSAARNNKKNNIIRTFSGGTKRNAQQTIPTKNADHRVRNQPNYSNAGVKREQGRQEYGGRTERSGQPQNSFATMTTQSSRSSTSVAHQGNQQSYQTVQSKTVIVDHPDGRRETQHSYQESGVKNL